jgi:hypothetical protein
MGLVLSLTALALHSMIHFPLQIPAFQLWAALLLGIAWSRRARNPQETLGATDDESTEDAAPGKEFGPPGRTRKSRRATSSES